MLKYKNNKGREDCDPSDDINVLLVLVICASSSFAFEVLCILLYKLLTRNSRS